MLIEEEISISFPNGKIYPTWTFDTLTTLTDLYGIDDNLLDATAKSMADEIDNQIIKKIMSIKYA